MSHWIVTIQKVRYIPSGLRTFTLFGNASLNSSSVRSLLNKRNNVRIISKYSKTVNCLLEIVAEGGLGGGEGRKERIDIDNRKDLSKGEIENQSEKEEKQVAMIAGDISAILDQPLCKI